MRSVLNFLLITFDQSHNVLPVRANKRELSLSLFSLNLIDEYY